MSFPENLAEREVAEILKKTGMVDESAPVFDPRSTFHEQVDSLRRRLFPPMAVMGAGLVNVALYSLAPRYYRWENGFNIGSLTVGGAILGILAAEMIAYYIASENS